MASNYVFGDPDPKYQLDNLLVLFGEGKGREVDFDGRNILMQYVGDMRNYPFDVTTLEYLLSVMDVNDMDLYRNNALMIYAHNNRGLDYEVIHSFIQAGVLVNETNISGYHVLFIILHHLDPSPLMISSLINAGADVNLVNEEILNTTPLLFAAQRQRSIEVFESLFENGADINMVNVQGQNVLICYFYHIPNIELEVVKYLISRVDINYHDYDGNNALLYLLQSHYDLMNLKEVIQLMLDSNIDINHVNNAGDNALLSYIKNNSHTNPSLVNVLVKGGIDIHYSNPLEHDYNVLLYFVKKSSSISVLTTLLDQGADILSCCGDGGSVLHHYSGKPFKQVSVTEDDGENTQDKQDILLLEYLLNCISNRFSYSC